MNEIDQKVDSKEHSDFAVEKVLISKKELQGLYRKIRDYELKIKYFEQDQKNRLQVKNKNTVTD